ncbi:MAG: phosphoserine aminotransferase [Alphaproteobacteria bacterium]|jgi:phosphoserine aminotransferase
MTELPQRPAQRPARTHFSSGPCSKRPGWSLENLSNAFLGRSHRASDGKARLKQAIDLTRDILGIPDDYLCGIVPASDTGAFELAMWSMLGERGVTALAWESFGKGWVTDAQKQLKLNDVDVVEAAYGDLPDLSAIDFSRDILFTANGTTSGVRIPNYDWIPADREGLTFADSTSAAFAQPIEWPKVDVLTFSWQKVMGGEAAHGMLILSPRAVERLERYVPDRPIPKIFRLTKVGPTNASKVDHAIFQGATINTPSMLCVEDYLDTLQWGQEIGGLPALMARADAGAKAINDWVDATPWIANLANDPATRSNTSVCLKLVAPEVTQLSAADQATFCKALVKRLETEAVAYDIDAYRDAPPGLRIWTGATVDADDLTILTDWIDWAYQAQLADLASAA